MTVRPAEVDHIDAMRQVERAAGGLFIPIGMADIAAHEPPAPSILAAYIRHGRAWVAEVDGDVVGYALADVVDGAGHLEQVSVHPEFARRGIGRTLIDVVVHWARSQGLDALTLLTFQTVPWNGPYYARLGFRPLADSGLGPDLQRLREHEVALGLDPGARWAMTLDLTE